MPLKPILLLSLLGLFSLVFSLQAQTGFVPESMWSNINPSTGNPSDFYITNTGVKVYGEIQSKYDEATYKTVSFKVDGVTNTFTPKDLKAFGLANFKFFLTKSLPAEPDLKFVEVLVSGSLQLNFTDNRYFLDNGSEMEELIAFYTQGELEGNKLKRYVRAYIGVLKIQMAGECGFKLNDLIEKTKMEESDFIRVFTEYHECMGLPYKVHTGKIKNLEFSPLVSYGLGFVSLADKSVETGQQNDLGNNISQRFQVGFRLHDFKKIPRLSLDLRIGLEQLNSTFFSSFESPGVVIITAAEEYKETSFFIPFSVNYSVYRSEGLDLYAGVLTSAWFRWFTSEGAIIQEEFIPSGQVNIYDDSFLTGVERRFFAGLKVGARFPVGKMVLFSELQGDLILDYYTTNILAKRSSFNRPTFSIQFGLEF